MILIHPPRSYPQMKGVAKRYGTRWCHLGSTDPDDLEPLHQLAQRLGIARRHFQNEKRPHYDVRASQFERAIELGAVEVDIREFTRRTR